jgi:hypothetical protein
MDVRFLRRRLCFVTPKEKSSSTRQLSSLKGKTYAELQVRRATKPGTR